jgi:1,5-anhydro-D-fructose reductase (1,5-anhydro-D-mannitol-forming)
VTAIPRGWGIVGAGTIAREFMVDAIRASGGTPLWVMSHSEERARAFASACDIPNHTTVLDQLLADNELEAVYIGSANGYHYAQVMAAAAAGKHVLSDKPLAVRGDDAAVMAQTCEKAGIALGVNHHLRASNVHRLMRRLISEGEIGVVHSMIIHHGGLLRPELRTWRLNEPEMGGGIYLDLTVHDVDLARFILGQEPVSVVGMGGARGLSSNGLDDHTTYAMQMTDGSLVQVHESFVTPGVVSRVTVCGSDGVLEAHRSIGQRDSGELVKGTGSSAEQIPAARTDLYAETVIQFHQLLRGEPSQIATGWDGVRSLRVAEAVSRAVRSGQMQTIPGANAGIA